MITYVHTHTFSKSSHVSRLLAAHRPPRSCVHHEWLKLHDPTKSRDVGDTAPSFECSWGNMRKLLKRAETTDLPMSQ